MFCFPCISERRSAPRAFAAATAKWLLQPSSEFIEKAEKVFLLFLGRFTRPNCPACHIVNKLMVPAFELVVIALAVARYAVPVGCAVNVGKIVRAVVPVFSGAQAGVKTGVVEFFHFRVGQAATVCMLNPFG
jgi:hypothetical protein